MSDEPKVTKIPVVSDDDFDTSEVVQMATQELLDNRKKELSQKVAKLFHKADQLAKDKRKAERDAESAGEKLDKCLKQIEALKSGDWSVLKEFDEKKDSKDTSNKDKK